LKPEGLEPTMLKAFSLKYKNWENRRFHIKPQVSNLITTLPSIVPEHSVANELGLMS
jgi:hypothetical protein